MKHLFVLFLFLPWGSTYAWDYALGDYSSNYSNKGIPNSMAQDISVSSELINKISTALPERKNVTLTNIYNRQILLTQKTIDTLHEDLQYDYNLELEELN